ncbi:MAG TPA: NfeD family protein [Candidatus Polarisedimenticolaceae bacterium]|nr:NfeD family protein [Candidatus Polarisedimenticolaceae bacterium]
MSIGLLYIALLIFGVLFAMMSGAMGWLSDLGGGDIHVDASGHLDTGHAHPISGTIVAVFVTGFGAGGTLGHYLLKWGTVGSLLLATGSGLVLATAAFLVLDLIFSQTQAGSEFAADAMIGRTAEVTTPIPENGAGEVAFEIKGQHESASARSIDGTAVGRGRLVVIEKVTGATVHVRAAEAGKVGPGRSQ